MIPGDGWLVSNASDLAVLAAGLAGLVYIVRIIWKARKPTVRFIRGVNQLVAIGETDKWPNGSTDLPSSLNEIYKRQCLIQLQLNDVSRDVEMLFAPEEESA